MTKQTDDWKGEHLVRIPRNPKAGLGAHMSNKKVHSRDASMIARREKLAVMAGKGATVTEMELATGVSRTTIFYDLKALGIKL